MSRSAARPSRAGASRRCRSRCGARGAGRRRGADRRRHSRRQRRRPGRSATIRSSPTARCRVSRPGGVRGGRRRRRDAARRAARLGEGRDRRADRRSSPSTRRLQADAHVLPDYALRRGDARAALAAAPHRAVRHVAHRRAGAFLSRRPGRARHSRRGRRHAGPFLDPASERECSISSRTCSACRSRR